MRDCKSSLEEAANALHESKKQRQIEVMALFIFSFPFQFNAFRGIGGQGVKLNLRVATFRLSGRRLSRLQCSSSGLYWETS
jgi:hypothetical protein